MQNQNNAIAAKHLTILPNQMQHELVACKKAECYASQFGASQLKAVASQSACDHRQRFNRLYNYLSSHA